MGYVVLPAGALGDFTKAVISFWFRVPQASADALAPLDGTTTPGWQTLIPLVVMGATGTSLIAPGQPTYFSQRLKLPTVIAYNNDTKRLFISIQTNKMPQLVTYLSTDGVPVFQGPPFNTWTFPGVTSPLSNDEYGASADVVSDWIYLGDKLDKWHHLLISVEMKPVAAYGSDTYVAGPDQYNYILSSPNLFVALDDVNYTGPDLSLWWTGNPNNLNQVAPFSAIFIGGSVNPDIGQTQSYILNDLTVPLSQDDFGIPATPTYAEHISRVEVAEFQMYTGVSIDTGVVANRRAFVNDKGYPVFAFVQDLANASSLKAAKLLGKQPDIVLHGSKRWMLGWNGGTAGVLKSKGRITAYAPSPKIGS